MIFCCDKYTFLYSWVQYTFQINIVYINIYHLCARNKDLNDIIMFVILRKNLTFLPFKVVPEVFQSQIRILSKSYWDAHQNKK